MTDAMEIRSTTEGASLAVRAQPGARKNRVVGLHDGALKVAVTAPPEDGRANEALVELLAGILGVKSQHVRLTQGKTDRRKVFEIVGMSPDSLRKALATILDEIQDNAP